MDAAAYAKIRDEGMNRSQVMEHMFWLTDRYGPRLTGSPGFEEAGDWAVKTLQSWGMQNVRKESWAFGKGWSLQRFNAAMVEPQVMPIIGMPKAWSAATKGPITAEVVQATVTNAESAAKYKGQLRGKIVLTQPAREVRMLDQPVVLRYADDPKWMEEALSMPPPRGRGAGAAGAGAPGGAGAGRAGRGNAFSVNQFFQDEGVIALVDRGANGDMRAGGSDLTWQTQVVDGGTVFLGAGGTRDATAGSGLPQITIAVEHYNRMIRLLEHNVPVKMSLDVEVKFRDETEPNGFNVIGELPGTDLADEVVLIGAHFDSWHGATGATDNAAGSAAMMEVLRILNATGVKPRRTVRVALWGGEEQGLLGSRDYANRHLGEPGKPLPENAKHVAYYNIDNGTGKIRGVWMQGNEAVKPIFSEWIRPLKDLGVEILGPRPVTSTDHTNL
ncbi:MAG TPA: M20/M25/M40 family metallo-hydrolase, partial [Vicinamibacterales bacterium]|nr:M20/M25/M40 family metallo-hydrolase [Vicinamibacterales bacterium]